MIGKLKKKIEELKKNKHNFIENENQEPRPNLLGEHNLKKGGKRKVTKGYLGSDIKAKRVEKKSKRGSTIKENEKQYNANYLDHEPKDFDYNGKKLWNRKFKSKKNKEGEETRRKEKITFDEGKQMKKRKQRTIKYGKNKGKVLSKTVSWKDGKRSVKKEYIDKVNTDKLKKGGAKYKDGGFLEGPTPILFED
tara:strand:- start:299 stop:877 length:579 start_codon:yes stop_codon:yes gene_type:complete